MPYLYAAAASPLGDVATSLLAVEQRTKGPKAVFAVILMFVALCGGAWLLLQSSFGPLQGYLITGTAFWGCWLVLGVLWLTGVPGLPGGIPRSTPRFLGPQGTEAIWKVLDTPAAKAAHPIPEGDLIEATTDITDTETATQITNAQTAVSEAAVTYYAKQTGAEAATLSTGIFAITKTEIAREDRVVKYARVTTGPAPGNADQTPDQKALIAKIKPATFDLWFDAGTLAQPTYYALGLFTVLFVLHAGALTFYELKEQDREAVAAA